MEHGVDHDQCHPPGLPQFVLWHGERWQPYKLPIREFRAARDCFGCRCRAPIGRGWEFAGN